MDDEIRVPSTSGAPSVGDRDSGGAATERRREGSTRDGGDRPAETPDWDALRAEVDRANRRLEEKGIPARVRLHRHGGGVWLQAVDPRRRRGRRTFRRVAPGEIDRLVADLAEGAGLGIDASA